MSTRQVDLLLTNTPPADILRATAARMREQAAAGDPGPYGTLPAVAALLDFLAAQAEQGLRGSVVQDGVDVARAYMLATGWRPEFKMTEAQR